MKISYIVQTEGCGKSGRNLVSNVRVEIRGKLHWRAQRSRGCLGRRDPYAILRELRDRTSRLEQQGRQLTTSPRTLSFIHSHRTHSQCLTKLTDDSPKRTSALDTHTAPCSSSGLNKNIPAHGASKLVWRTVNVGFRGPTIETQRIPFETTSSSLAKFFCNLGQYTLLYRRLPQLHLGSLDLSSQLSLSLPGPAQYSSTILGLHRGCSGWRTRGG
jgi:hypothetical protein